MVWPPRFGVAIGVNTAQAPPLSAWLAGLEVGLKEAGGFLGRWGDGDVMPVRPEDEEALRRAEERVGSSRAATACCSEFYRYHTRRSDAGKRGLLSFDTAVSVVHLFAMVNAHDSLG